MSGFSSAISGMASGLGQGLVSQGQGQDAQLNYDALLAKKKQAEQLSNNNQTLFEQQQKQNDLKLNQMYLKQAKTTVDFTKKSFVPLVNNFIDEFQKAQDNGGLVEKIDPKNGKVYNVPADLTDSVKDMKKALVYDPQGSDWINGFLANKYGTDTNPINDVTYDETSHQIILTQSDGTEIPMSPLMMTHTLGLGKYMSTRKLQQLTAQTAADTIKYKGWKAKADIMNANSTATKTNSEISLNKTKADTANIKAQEAYKQTQIELQKLKNLSMTPNQINAGLQKINEAAYNIVSNPNATKTEVKPVVDALLKNKVYTDSLVKSQNTLYRKVNQLQYFRDKSTSLSSELNKLADGAKTGTFETINKMFLRYTGKALSKKEYLKANDISTRINLMVMDYLQYKSGAAFGAEELKGYQAAGGVLDFNSPALAKSSIQAMSTYLGSKLKANISAVPTASDRLVLGYKAGFYNDSSQPKQDTKPIDLKSVMTKIGSFTTQDELVKYANELKNSNPELYRQVQQQVNGGQ